LYGMILYLYKMVPYLYRLILYLYKMALYKYKTAGDRSVPRPASSPSGPSSLPPIPSSLFPIPCLPDFPPQRPRPSGCAPKLRGGPLVRQGSEARCHGHIPQLSSGGLVPISG
jgi:hypothetical protein